MSLYDRQPEGGPTVNWSSIHPKLSEQVSDILVLLDCCFAAQAARANQKRAIPSNVELLAACAMRVKTILPGPLSFTTHLIKHLRDALETSGHARISDIANMLAHRDSGCIQTPVHFSGLGNRKGTIRLDRFDPHPGDSLHARREVAWLTLRVSLRDVLTDPLIADIIQWFKAHPSRKVAKLTVERVALSTGNLHHFIHEEGRGRNAGPRFERLPAPAKHEILTAWSNFRTVLAALATQLRTQSSTMDEETSDHEVAVDAQKGLLGTLLELENGLLSLQDTVQRSIMALPDLYGNREALIKAIEDTAMRDLGFVPSLHRRLKAFFPSPLGNLLQTDHVVEFAPNAPKIFQTLVKENLSKLGPVLVEYKDYYRPLSQRSDRKRIEQRIQVLADLLQTRGSPQFHTLRCTQWFHEPNDLRFGLVFEYPAGHDGFKTLRDLIQTASSTQRPTLGQRFLMVRSIGEAILNWHTSANWVHQGIASHNIIFFKPVGSPNIDYSKPYLCGFEFSRPSTGISDNAVVENFEMNVYRHPSRQGAPSEFHTKKHDLYSFGILMLEVGIWDLVSKCFNAKLRKDLVPEKMHDHIKLHARKRLGHHMGAAYERASSRCLNIDFGVELDDHVGTQLARMFEKLVLKELHSGMRLD